MTERKKNVFIEEGRAKGHDDLDLSWVRKEENENVLCREHERVDWKIIASAHMPICDCNNVNFINSTN